MGRSRRGRVRAPELAGRGGWINSRDALFLKALRGKVVLLDFWTFCCINCLHVLDELRPLEERFGDALVVVGVHSPKFEHERDHAALVRAVARYDVRHAVLDDPDRATWDQYAVRAWPTLVLVDPQGYAVAAFEGEGNAPKLEKVIVDMISEHREKRTLLDETSIETLPPAVASGPLRFPGKVAAGPDGLLAVADSGHNRIVVARVNENGEGAEAVAVAGTGACGDGDGTFPEASFSDPQGLLVLDERALLVADKGNHAVRRLDLTQETVETVAGTGEQARQGAEGGPAGETALNSLWDLELWGGTVVIAMAAVRISSGRSTSRKRRSACSPGTGRKASPTAPRGRRRWPSPAAWPLRTAGSGSWTPRPRPCATSTARAASTPLSAPASSTSATGTAPPSEHCSNTPWASSLRQRAPWSATPTTPPSGATTKERRPSPPSLATVWTSPPARSRRRGPRRRRH